MLLLSHSKRLIQHIVFHGFFPVSPELYGNAKDVLEFHSSEYILEAIQCVVFQDLLFDYENYNLYLHLKLTLN